MADELAEGGTPIAADAAPTLGSVARGGRALLVRYVLAFFVSFGGGVALARLLGPATMGVYYVSSIVLSVLREVIDLGGRQYLVQLKDEPGADEIRTVTTMQHVAGLAGVGLTAAAYPIFLGHGLGHDALILIVSAGVGAFFTCWQSVPTAVLERRLRYARIGAIELFDTIAFYATAVAGGAFGFGIWGLAAGNAARGFAPAILSWALADGWPGLGFGLSKLRATAKALGPFIASRSVFWVVLLSPAVIVPWRSGVEALGLAQTGMGVLGYSLLFPTILHRVGFGTLSRLQHDDEKFRGAFRRGLELVCLFAFPMSIGVFSIAMWWSPLVYGPRWAGLERVFVIGALPTAFDALLGFMDAAVVARGGIGLCMRRLIVHAVVYAAVLAVAAKRYGALAVPMAQMAAQAAGLVPVAAYARLCGPLALGRFLALWAAAGVGGAASCWLTVRGWVPAAVALWIVLPAAWLAGSSSARRAVRASLAGLKEM